MMKNNLTTIKMNKSKTSNLIMFDCERMKNPHTGIYFFCDILAENLSLEAPKGYQEKLAFYVPKSLIGRWGAKHLYKIIHLFHKFKITGIDQVKVWHTTYQLSSYIPSGKKLVLTIHDLNFLYEKTEIRQKHYIRKMQRIVDKATHIVVISEATRKDLYAHIDVKGKPVDVIYDGCNIYTGNFQQPDTLPQRPFLFTIGTVLPKKNFHVLPGLLKDNDYELIIAGIRFEYETRILEEAKKAGVSDRIRFVGTISEAVKHWYFLNCKAFLFPSIAEGFGLPVIEAMYYQKPIFLSNHTCLPEIGGEFAYYFNTEFNEAKMRTEFQEGMEDFERGGKDKVKMREHALHFSWHTAAKKYWNIYLKLLNEE